MHLISSLDFYRFKSENYSNFKTLLLSLNDIVRIFNNRHYCKIEEKTGKELIKELKLFDLYWKNYYVMLIKKVMDKLNININQVSDDWENTQQDGVSVYTNCSPKSRKELFKLKYVVEMSKKIVIL